MRHRILFFFLAFIGISQFVTSSDVRNKYNFNSDWLLYVGDTPEAKQIRFSDSDWKKVTLPHAFNEDEAFRLSIDELTDKAERVYLLRQKYQEVREKRKQLESFTISHDKNNAQLTLVDAKGLSISTSNPVAIGKLLSDWMLDLNNHLAKSEEEIRSELERLN